MLRPISRSTTNFLCGVLFVFFTSIHLFGWLGIYETDRLQHDTDEILKQLGMPSGDSYGHTEFFWFKLSIYLANVSFVLVSFIWIGIWRFLLKRSGFEPPEIVPPSNGTPAVP